MRISDWSSDVCSSDLASHSFLEVRLYGRVDWNDRVLVLNEVAQMGIFLVADRRFKADRFLGDIHHLAPFFKRHREALGHFLGRRLEIGRAHVCTPVTNAHLVCRLMLEKKPDTTARKRHTSR